MTDKDNVSRPEGPQGKDVRKPDPQRESIQKRSWDGDERRRLTETIQHENVKETKSGDSGSSKSTDE